MIQKLAVLLLVFLGLFEVNGFSSGAPPDACVKDRFNQPHHGEHRSQSLETLPYQVTASSAFYQPGESVTGAYKIFEKRCKIMMKMFGFSDCFRR